MQTEMNIFPQYVFFNPYKKDILQQEVIDFANKNDILFSEELKVGKFKLKSAFKEEGKWHVLVEIIKDKRLEPEFIFTNGDTIYAQETFWTSAFIFEKDTVVYNY